jgi:hypothetical protein
MTTAADEKLGRVIAGAKAPGGATTPKMSRLQRGVFDLVAATNHWASDRAAKVSRFYLLTDADGVRLFLVGRADEYDFALSKELADFAREWSRKIPVVPMLIPACTAEELTAYFDPDTALGISVG